MYEKENSYDIFSLYVKCLYSNISPCGTTLLEHELYLTKFPNGVYRPNILKIIFCINGKLKNLTIFLFIHLYE